MGDKLNSMTIGELVAILAGGMILFSFIQKIISPLIQKWLKIEKNEHDLEVLQALPHRVTKLEEYNNRNFKAIQSTNEINVLMMEALLALIKNKTQDGDLKDLEKIENKLTGFLVGKVGN